MIYIFFSSISYQSESFLGQDREGGQERGEHDVELAGEERGEEGIRRRR